MKYKVVAIDVDGTLLNSNADVSDGAQEALKAVQTQGIHPVLITGRTAWVLKPLLQELPVSPYYISDGGACLAHASQGIIALDPLPRPVAELITKMARERGLGLCFHEVDGMCCELDEETLERLRRVVSPLLTRVDDVLASSPGDPVKITVFGQQPQLRAMDQALARMDYKIHTTFSGPIYLEITHEGVSKGHALQLLADHMGISPHEILAIGDQENDLSSFEVVGFSVAMGNAPEIVKQAADYVTHSNDAGGLAHALRHLLLEHKDSDAHD